MDDIDAIIDKLLDYFEVSTITELAKKMKLKQSTISSWKLRKSLMPIKRTCRELGIYKDVFDDSTNFIQQGNNNRQNNSGTSYDNIHIVNEDIENLELLKALNATAIALNKKDHLKAELTKIFSTLSNPQ